MKSFSLSCLCLGLLAWPGHRAPGQSPQRPQMPDRYQVSVWRDKDGLPQNSVYALARTRDGYLWLGTVEGLVRFDGVRFTIFDTSNTPQIGNNRINALLEDRDGVLWIGTAGGGLTRYREGKFTRYTAADGLAENHVTCLCQCPDGGLWVGTLAHGLTRWQGERGAVPAWNGELPDPRVRALTTDASGNLWVGTSGGVAAVRGAAVVPYAWPGDLGENAVICLCCDHASVVWIGTEKGLRRFEHGHMVVVDPEEGLPRGPVRALMEDAENHLWVGGWAGAIFVRRSQSFTACLTQEKIPAAQISVFLQDPSGSVWIGMDEGGGFVRLRRGRFGVYTTQDGLDSDFVRAVFQDDAGTVWVGTSLGLNRFEDGRFSRCTPPDYPFMQRTNAVVKASRGICVSSTIGGNWGVYWYRGDRFVPVDDTGMPLGIALLADRSGGLWIGTIRGLVRVADDGGVSSPGSGLDDEYIENLLEDRAGSVWVATVGQGIARCRDGSVTRWTTAQGLPSNHILAFYEDHAGTLWIGTEGGGLTRFRNGRFAAITTRQGLSDNVAFAMLEDDFGNLWMSGNKGIYRAGLQELNDCADGRLAQVHSFTYDATDGMLSRECNGGCPAAWKMRDGTLWFPTVKGIVVVDPSQRNTQEPHVVIEGATVDLAALPAGQPVRLRPGQENLEIQYTALSWQRPQQVRFQYQLAGLSRDWTDAGTRRTAYFSHLPPGAYTFQVRAENGDGVWSVAPVDLSIVVLPPFWRTWWLVWLAVLAAAALISAGFRWRGQQLRRRYAVRQEFSRRLIAAHESERRRIAADLHDGLGQTLAMIKNNAVFGTRNARDLEAAKAQMEQITQQSSQAIGEVREIAYNLRPYLLDKLGLTKALRSMLNKVADTSNVVLTVDIDDLDGRFSADAEMSIYRVVQESLNNVLKHARAAEGIVRIKADDTHVSITVQDDGQGFDTAAHHESEPGGFGLLGIAERVRILGGTYTVQSAPREGTTLLIQLPCGGATNKEP